MRPLELRLTAFGPYPGTEAVDFRPLAGFGLFVVAGPTGSGKSTLFDAMTFALFGAIPGERVDHVRSHHATPDAVTGAALTFDAAGARFLVERTARHDRPSRRGRGITTTAPTAALYRIEGESRIPIASRIQEVNARCEQLVGLTAAQFQRVILLPQGRWTEFLLSDTRSRRELLQQLFGTRLYERATLLAHDRAAELKQRVEGVSQEIERHRSNAVASISSLVVTLDGGAAIPPDATVDDLAHELTTLTPRVAAHRAAAAAASVRAGEARRAHDVTVAAAANWDRRARLQQRIAELDAERTAMTIAIERHAEGVRAATVVTALRARDDAAARAQRAADALHAALERARLAASAAGAEGTPEEMPARIAELRARWLEQRELTTELDRLEAECRALEVDQRRAAAALEQQRRDVRAITSRRAVIGTELHHQTAAAGTIARCNLEVDAAGHVLTLRRELDELGSHAEVAAAAAADAAATLESLTERFLADVAPELAAHLRPGHPCPVCGSERHPAPARPHPTTSVTRDDLAVATDRRDRATRALHDVLARLDDTRRRLGDRVGEPVAALAAAHGRAVAAQRAAACAEADVLRLNMELAAIDKAMAEADERLPQLIRTSADVGATLSARQQTVATLRMRTEGNDRTDVANRLDLLGRAERAVGRLGELRRAAAATAGALDQAEQHLATALDIAGFPALEPAVAAALPPDELEALKCRTERWRRDLAEAEARCASLDDLQLPARRPALDELLAEATRAEATAVAAADRQRVLDVRSADAAEAIATAVRLEREARPWRAEHETATSVFETCNGANAPRVQLETWVLAGELDRVTAAANVHLARMTRHRYSLRRDAPSGIGARRSGLDLVVDDADTGRPRPPGTLSGGEQFQASLALALGLADVISQGGAHGSGDVHEALFVDEGFGSLDAEALDEAVDALVALHATGRMVGVITHVEAMKRQLPVGIEVRKLPAGGSTLV